MNGADLRREIGRGKELFSEVLRLTSDFLERMPGLEPADIDAFEDRRRKLLALLLGFNAAFKQKLSGVNRDMDPELAKQLEEFRIFQEVFVQIIMEKNRAIVSLAGQELERIRTEFDAVGRGKQAISGYGKIREIADDSRAQTA